MPVESKSNQNMHEKKEPKLLNQTQKVQLSKYGIYSVTDNNILIESI